MSYLNNFKIVLLTFCAFFSSIGLSIAQTGNNTTTTSKTISLENLDLKQKTWLNDNGFPISGYDLSNNDINLHLRESLSARQQARTWTTVGLVGAGVSTILLFTKSYSGFIAINFFSGGALFYGLIRSNKARQKVRNASYLYYEKK